MAGGVGSALCPGCDQHPGPQPASASQAGTSVPYLGIHPAMSLRFSFTWFGVWERDQGRGSWGEER